MPFCAHCGNQEPEEAAFCNACGRSIIMPSLAIPSSNTLQSVRETPGKTRLRNSDRESGQGQQRKRYTRKLGGSGRLVKVLLLMIMVGVILGVVIAIPAVFHPSSPTTIGATLAPYAGDWEHHDFGLTINTNGTGKDRENFGFSCDNGNRDCGRTGTLQFTPISGAIIGTYISVSYDLGIPLTLDDVQKGDLFRLTLAPHDRLILTWLGKQLSLGSMSLCGPKTPLEFQDCGA